ncbi:hypothetical protein M514_11332 [Trichuris suis]|uniref:Uncharacterized protein n=1 Tax=Trichuris suis TaxID=68888 RepID=A0A085MRW8_9BILA|nr:hypothetical protein M514_11332 [Trichuris suis]
MVYSQVRARLAAGIPVSTPLVRNHRAASSDVPLYDGQQGLRRLFLHGYNKGIASFPACASEAPLLWVPLASVVLAPGEQELVELHDLPSCTGASASASAIACLRCLFQRAVTLLFIPEMEVIHTAATERHADQCRARLRKISSSYTLDCRKNNFHGLLELQHLSRGCKRYVAVWHMEFQLRLVRLFSNHVPIRMDTSLRHERL